VNDVIDVTKGSGGTAAVDRLTFRVRPGRVTGFPGPNAAGKPTTPRIALGLDAPTGDTVPAGGRAFLDDRDVYGGRRGPRAATASRAPGSTTCWARWAWRARRASVPPATGSASSRGVRAEIGGVRVIRDILGPYAIIDDVSESTSTSRKRTSAQTRSRVQARPVPQPEPIRFFGTTWVEHDSGYRRRRVAVAAGSLAAAAAGAFALRFGFQGLVEADVNVLVVILAVCGFAVCSALAFQRTWQSFTTPKAGGGADDDADASRGVYAIGFIGALLAYFVRSLREAPGEGLARAAYESTRTPRP